MARVGKLKPGGLGAAAAREPLDCPDGFVYAWGERRRPELRRIAAKKAATMGQIKRHHATDAAVVVPGVALLDGTSKVVHPIFRRITASRLAANRLVATRRVLVQAPGSPSPKVAPEVRP